MGRGWVGSDVDNDLPSFIDIQVVDSDQPTMYCVIHKLHDVMGSNPGDAVTYQQGEK